MSARLSKPGDWRPGGQVARDLLSLTRPAAPIALAGIVNLAMSISDALLMADLDPRALTAGVVIGDIFSITIQFAAGALGAASAPVAAAMAAGDMARAGRSIADGLKIGLVLAMVGGSVIALSPAALLAAGVHLPLPEVAAEYAAYMAVTFAVMMVVALARSVFPAFGASTVVLGVMIAAVPLNFTADLALMHGWGGVPAMGLAGAGAASLLVATAMAGALLAYLLATPRLKAAGIWRHAFRLGPEIVSLTLARAALFTGATALCETGVYLSSTVIVAYVAIDSIPSHIVVFRTLAITYVIGTGFAQALTIQLARRMALAEDTASLIRAAAVGMVALAGTILAVMLALPVAGGELGTDVGGVRALVPWAAAAACNLVPAVVAFGILKARSDVAVPSLISFAGYWGIGFTLVVCGSGPLGLGAVGIWAGLAVGTTATAAGLWVYLLRRPTTPSVAVGAV